MKFSIVIATYNRREPLQKCIESILSQTYKDFEIIVVDDGSTDDTAEFMRRYNDEPLVRYIQLEKNHGSATPARNKGIDCMTGDVFIRWDSDDVLLPHALEYVFEGFQNHPRVGIVCAHTDFVYEGVKQSRTNIPGGVIPAHEWFGSKRPKDAVICAIKKQYIGEVRFEAKNIDYVFYAKVVGNNSTDFFYIPETCGIMNLESDSLSLTTMRKNRNAQLSIVRAPILDDFVQQYGHWYLQANAPHKLAGYAFGSAVGYILDEKFYRASCMLKIALSHCMKFSWLAMYIALIVPGGGVCMRALLRR